VGIVNKGSESRFELLLLAAVDRFVSTWRFDNPKGANPAKTSNYCVQPTAGADLLGGCVSANARRG
jgi:hypothetical protein